jgi:hypothetical protein
MYTAEDLQAKFESQMNSSAEDSAQSQPDANTAGNTDASPSADPMKFANNFKMNVADRLVPVEDDGTIRQSNMRM